MASASSPMTLYQCSECEHCSSTLDDATIHAYEAHRPEDKEHEDEAHFTGFEELEDDLEEQIYPNKRFKAEKNDIDFDLNFQTSSTKKSKSDTIYIADMGSLKRAEMWQQENTKQLINCVKDNFPDLKNRMLKKKHIWENIRNVIATKMPGITRRQCEQKWRNLLNSQRRYMVSSKVSKSRVKKPEFFSEIAGLVGNDIYKMVDSTSNNDPLGACSLDYDSQRILLAPDEDEPLKLSAFEISDNSSDNTSLLLKILNTLEMREISRNSFQRQVIELEKTKLQAMRKFIDVKEQQNFEKIQILKNYLNPNTSNEED